MYSAVWCAYCRSLKQKLDSMDVLYTIKDVDNPEIREEMNKKTNNNQTIPVLFVGDNYWVNPDMNVLHEQF
jgi:glutaredoxin